MKQIILTADYELFLGRKTGSVQECMIEPTKQLVFVLEPYDSKMTVFWDILHFYKLLELEDQYSEIKNDRIAIQNQICELIKKGYDVQLHLHPHWLDAKYIDRKWDFSYEHFNLQSLSNENNPSDINTILGCVTIGRNLMESIIHTVNKNYKVYAFRAGGYLIEPFDEIRKALLANEIYVDSSTCPGLINENGMFSYNFEKIPREIKYKFNTDLNMIDKKGEFVEIPISSIRVSIFRKIYNVLINRLKYKKLESGRIGVGSGNTTQNHKSIFNKAYSIIFERKYQILTTDNSFNEKYNYLLSKAKENSTQILHPKLLNQHTLNLLQKKLSNKEVKFVSIKGFLDE